MESKSLSNFNTLQFYPYQMINYPVYIQYPQLQNMYCDNNFNPAFYQYSILNVVQQPNRERENDLNRDIASFGGNEDWVKTKDRNKENQRNMISNSVKVFKKYVKDSVIMGQHFIDKIIKKMKLQYSEIEFLENLDKMLPQKKNYYGSKFIIFLLCSKETSTNFRIVLRIALYYYYRNSSHPTVLSSKKIIGKNKKTQLNAGRKMIKQLTDS